MPTDPKWREAQLQAMLALGDAPQDAERVLAAMERLSPDDPTVLPDSEAFAAMFGQVTPDDVRDATADWMVRARPEWKRLLTASVKVSEFNAHHDALGRFAPGSAAVGLSYHALGRIGKQGRANVTSVRDALEKLQSVKTPDSDWSYPLKQGDKLRGHLIGTDGVVKTVVGAWYKPDKLPPALAEFNPYHDALGRFATGGGAMAADTGGGGGGTVFKKPIHEITDTEGGDIAVRPSGLSSGFVPGDAGYSIARSAQSDIRGMATGLTLLGDDGKVEVIAALGMNAPDRIRVNYLASCVKGGGTRMMAEISRKAASENKSVSLHALSEAVGFYEHIGMSAKGGNEFLFSPTQAKAFADRVLGAE